MTQGKLLITQFFLALPSETTLISATNVRLLQICCASCSTRYLTSELRSLVRYRGDHSKIKFISTRGHVISSIYYMANPVLGKSLCSDWFSLGQGFAVGTVSMETVQAVYFCFEAKSANSKFATKTAKKKV